MADKGRVDAEKKKAEKKKRMIVVSEGPSLVGEDTAHEPLPLLRPTIADRPTTSVVSTEGVAYLCVYGKDLLRNREMSSYRKMSSVDRIRHGQANMLQEKTFDRAVKDICTLLARSYSDFDFFAFDEDLKKATDSRVRKLSDPAVDKSENFSEESLSNKESGTMSSDDDDERFVADLALEKGKRTRHS
ncbi:hypothetical protein LWI28_012113 [Acer negundo]|uniref:Uncharacterized protein n=1 Tax=Acer negundo TaxID=4023 RepID=A0AAD5JDP6_ACENE|nr:hypothetical protein LWI28_012113 [Acer negundo]